LMAQVLAAQATKRRVVIHDQESNCVCAGVERCHVAVPPLQGLCTGQVVHLSQGSIGRAGKC
jgi:hypothetical protein